MEGAGREAGGIEVFTEAGPAAECMSMDSAHWRTASGVSKSAPAGAPSRAASVALAL
jgi:hypothetical protein